MCERHLSITTVQPNQGESDLSVVPEILILQNYFTKSCSHLVLIVCSQQVALLRVYMAFIEKDPLTQTFW